MEPTSGNDDEDDDKLIPEWGVAADDQIIWIGLAVVAAMVAFFGWNLWSGDDDGAEAVAGPLTNVVPAGALDDDGDIGRALAPASPVATTSPPAASTTEAAAATTTEAAAATTSTTEAPTTTAAPTIGDVQAAVSSLPGAITGANDGSTAVLEGFVANQGEADAAEAAAAA
ncbi:MAG: hypothetical protein AAFN30_17195, partial [Actinomycetota bacterium]